MTTVLAPAPAPAPVDVKPPGLGAKVRRRRPNSFSVLGVGLALFSIALVIFPLYRICESLFYTNGHFTLSAFREFGNAAGVGSAIRNTTIVVAVSSPIAVAIGGLMAWLNERTDARMGVVTDLLPFVPFLSPQIATAIGWVFLLAPAGGFLNAVLRSILGDVGVHMTSGPFNVYSIYGVIFLYVMHAIPYSFLMISAGIRSMDSQLEEQSRMCGADRVTTLRKVVLPAVLPSVASALLLAIWTGYSLYSLPQIVAGPSGLQIMSVSIVRFLTFDSPPQYGPAVVMGLIMILFVGVAWYAQTAVLKRARYSTSGARGHRAPRVKLGAWKWPVRALFVLYVGFATVLPAVALLLVTLNGFWTPHLGWSKFDFSAFHDVFSNGETLQALKDSLEFGVVIATVAVLAAAVISVLTRSKSARMQLLDGSLKLPVIISHVVLAVGFILAFAGPPFNLGATRWILFLAYFALFMPQGTLISDSIAAQVGRELSEASRLFGAGSFRTFAKIFLPLMASGLAVGWALLFVKVLGDLEVSSLLASTTSPTIGSQTLEMYNQGQFSDVGALTLILLLITVVIVGSVLTLARRRSKWAVAETVSTARL